MFDQLAQIKLGLAEHLQIDVDGIEDDTLIADLGLDSLDVVELLVKFENKFGVYVADEDISGLKTPRLVEEYLERYH